MARLYQLIFASMMHISPVMGYSREIYRRRIFGAAGYSAHRPRRHVLSRHSIRLCPRISAFSCRAFALSGIGGREAGHTAGLLPPLCHCAPGCRGPLQISLSA